MQEGSKYMTYEFSGVLAGHLQDFISEKRGIGYIYNTEAKHLSRFSRFSLDYEVPPDLKNLSGHGLQKSRRIRTETSIPAIH